jgi:hypothetical protein
MASIAPEPHASDVSASFEPRMNVALLPQGTNSTNELHADDVHTGAVMELVPIAPAPPTEVAASTDAIAVAVAPDALTGEVRARLQARMQQARAYVWMHSRCGRWATSRSVFVTVVQCIISYAAGCLGVSSNANHEIGLILTYIGVVFSFLVGVITTLAKLKCANFDAVVEQHTAAVTAWNALWSHIEMQLDLPAPQRMPTNEFLTQVGTTFASHESNSEALLPIWVRRQCAAAWKKEAPTEALPDMCRDATVVA